MHTTPFIIPNPPMSNSTDLLQIATLTSDPEHTHAPNPDSPQKAHAVGTSRARLPPILGLSGLSRDLHPPRGRGIRLLVGRPGWGVWRTDLCRGCVGAFARRSRSRVFLLSVLVFPGLVGFGLNWWWMFVDSGLGFVVFDAVVQQLYRGLGSSRVARLMTRRLSWFADGCLGYWLLLRRI